MGVVISQSFKNTVYTYAGFAIGAVNTLFLYTNFLTDEYYGLVSYILSVANIMTPILTFGVQNTLIKFYFSYKERKEQAGFTGLMLWLPLIVIIPCFLIGWGSYDFIAGLLSRQNAIVYDYVWVIFVTAVSMAYFEVFFAWTRAHMRSVFGNFLKEVFHRVVVMALLFAVYFKWISIHDFIIYTMIMYVARTFLMGISAYIVKKPTINFSIPSNVSSVIKYSALIILAGSVAIVLLDIDKFMIGQYGALENVAFYTVAVFIAVVITVPTRSMNQIVYPLTAKLMSEKNKGALVDLYKKSSLNLYLIGGLIFLLIMLNINELYKIMPEQYSGGVLVVFLISLAKLSDCLLGNNNAILFNSDYYRMVLFFGVMLTILTIVLNMIFIPWLGINGAAIATLLAFLIYNTIKIWFVHEKMKMHPFSSAMLWTTFLLIGLSLLFYFWDFPFDPIINIGLKSILISGIYGLAIWRLKLSEDINVLLKNLLKKKNP